MNTQKLFDPNRKIAMLIDGDNAQHSSIEKVCKEVKRYGDITVRRAYGDWSQDNLANWSEVLIKNGIQQVQQPRYNGSKNATDGKLIIDAMDLLYSGKVDGFCIVSSDSDFTALCIRIREAGLFVMGVGRSHTNDAFVNACDVFSYTDKESVKPAPSPQVNPSPVKQAQLVKAPIPTPVVAVKQEKVPQLSPTEAKKNNPKLQQQALSLIRKGFESATKDKDSWVAISALGTSLSKLEPKFNSKTYGFSTLSLFLKSQPKHIEVKGAQSAIRARLKPTK